MKTRITEMLGIKYPILSAGMGPFSTTKLAAAVTNAGGCGLLSQWGSRLKVDPDTMEFIDDPKKAKTYMSWEKLELDINYIMENSKGPFGCNIRVARVQIDYPKCLETIIKMRNENPEIKERLKIVVTSAGNPAPPHKQLKEGTSDLLHFHVSPSLRLVHNTFKAGCDGVVAVGYEGGGHQSYEKVHTLVLIPEVRNHYPDKPIIAGGGFYDGAGLASALTMGADAIQMGSRLIATKDCEFHPNYKQMVVNGKDESTEVCQGAFGPIRLHKNKYTAEHNKLMTREEKMKQEKDEGLLDPKRLLEEQVRKESLAYALVYMGDIENGAVLLGQSIGGVDDIPTVKELLDRMVSNAEKRIKEVTKLF
ncbi:MAG: NAD(P)H-dependent flavin oxidoreductase [Candidatus Hodarchaeota archaeon]